MAALEKFKVRRKALEALKVLDKTFETKKARDSFIDLDVSLIHLVIASPADAAAKADAMIAKTEAALTKLERLVADLPAKAKAASDEAATINSTADADLSKLSVAQKVRMVETLLAAGQPTGAVRAAQVKVYGAMHLDPAFMEEDQERGKQIAADLKDDAELLKARTDWAHTSQDEKLKVLRKVVAVQSRHLGIEPLEIATEDVSGEVTTGGDFDPDENKLLINVGTDSRFGDFTFALTVALHESAHKYQAYLVRQLEAGKLKPGTPDYVQATMFRVNDLKPGGYIEGNRNKDLPAYGKQPTEAHSFATGSATAAEIVKALEASEAHSGHPSPVRRH